MNTNRDKYGNYNTQYSSNIETKFDSVSTGNSITTIADTFKWWIQKQE